MQVTPDSEAVGQHDLFVSKTWGNNIMFLKYCQSLNISVKSEEDDNLLQAIILNVPLQTAKNYLEETDTQKGYCDAIRRCFYKRPSLSSSSSSEGETDEVLFRRICERVSHGLGWSANRSCRCVRAASAPVTFTTDMVAAFRMHYKKDQHLTLLYQQIQEVLGSLGHVFAPSVSIYQHSGSGKTKTVIELGLCVFPLLYLCFREYGTEGYPSTAASPLRKYLLFDEPSSSLEAPVASQLEVYIRYAAFQVASLVLFSRFWSETRDASGENEESFRRRLSMFLNAQLDGSVDERGCYLLERLHDLSKDIEVWLSNGFGDVNRYFDYGKWVWKWANIEATATTLLEAYKPSLTNAFPTDRVVGVICFDEERIFRKICSVDQHGTKQPLSMHMLRASRLLRLLNTRCCLIRMDTMPAMDDFGPVAPLKYNPSARLVDFSRESCAYTLTSARNVGADEEFERTTDLSQTINTLSYMVRFGCPLWYSSTLRYRYDLRPLLQDATKKLRGGLSKTPDPIPLEYSAALLGATISIDVSPYISLAKTLVSNHMAQLEYWFPDRNFCKVGYPPDAILAVAAADELFSEDYGSFRKHMANFMRLLDQQPLSRWEIAERVTRLLLLKAASEHPVDCIDDSAPPMAVASFLRHLLGERNEKAARDRVATVHPEGSDAAAILDGIINLRQFVPIGPAITRPDVCLAAKRGFGYICRRDDVGVDLLIPVILKRPLRSFASEAAAMVASKKRQRPESTSPAPVAAPDTAGHAAPPVFQNGTTSVAASTTEPRMLSADDLSFADWHRLHLRTSPDQWAVTSPGIGVSLERLRRSDTASTKVQETSVHFPRMSASDLQTKHHQFSPEYVSYIAVRVSYRSEGKGTIFDPLALLEPDLRSREGSTMPRLALNMVCESLLSEAKPSTGHYDVLTPHRPTSTASVSALTSMCVVNAHCLLTHPFQSPLSWLLQPDDDVPYRSLSTKGNWFSIQRRPRVSGTENRPVASMEL